MLKKTQGKIRRERVLLVSLHYRPEPNFITADLAEFLASKGKDVTVITAHPSYPLGQFYDSVASLTPHKTFENGVTLWRLPVIPDHSKSKLRRAGYYMSFALMAFIWNFFVAPRQDHLIVYQTPFTTALSVVWRKFLGSRLTYIVCDLWPESFPASGIRLPCWLYSSMNTYSRFINRFADRIITSTNGIRNRYIADGLHPSIVQFFPVWVDGLPRDPASSELAASATVDIVYAGNLGPAQGLDVLIQAANLLKHRPEIQYHIYGTGSEEENLKQLCQTLGTSAVHFHGRVDPDTAFACLQKATFVFLHLKRSPLFHMTIPSKLASLLACGRLILCGAEGETSDIVSKHEAGLVFEAENPESLAKTILAATQSPIEEQTRLVTNARLLYKRSFCKEALLECYYHSITEPMNFVIQTGHHAG